MVCKTHRMDTFKQRGGSHFKDMDFNQSSGRYLFVTSAGGKDLVSAAEHSDVHNLIRQKIAYTARTAHLGKDEHGPFLLNDYVKVLGLQKAEVDVLHTFLDSWSKLRVCCGAQMSEDYRKRLVPNATLKFQTSFFGSHGDGQRSGDGNGQRVGKTMSTKLAKMASKHKGELSQKASDKCELYDLDAIEHALLSTAVFKTCGGRKTLISRLSARDMPLDGTYCSRSTAAAIKHGFKFNDKRYRDPGAW